MIYTAPTSAKNREAFVAGSPDEKTGAKAVSFEVLSLKAAK